MILTSQKFPTAYQSQKMKILMWLKNSPRFNRDLNNFQSLRQPLGLGIVSLVTLFISIYTYKYKQFADICTFLKPIEVVLFESVRGFTCNVSTPLQKRFPSDKQYKKKFFSKTTTYFLLFCNSFNMYKKNTTWQPYLWKKKYFFPVFSN